VIGCAAARAGPVTGANGYVELGLSMWPGPITSLFPIFKNYSNFENQKLYFPKVQKYSNFA
jgi:hypothetical protein